MVGLLYESAVVQNGDVVSSAAALGWWCAAAETRFLRFSSPVFVEDIAPALRVMDVGISGALPPHGTLIDVRELREVHLFLAEIPRWALSNHDALGKSVRRAAVVSRDLAAAGLVAGHHAVGRVPYQSHDFSDGIQALAWLGCKNPESVWTEWESISSTHDHRLDRRLRAFVAANLPNVTLESSAAALGLTPRSLQRHLAVSGDTFREYANRMRVLRAQQLLRDGNKLASVSIEVGLQKPANLNRLFVLYTGMTALAWKKSTSVADSTPTP